MATAGSFASPLTPLEVPLGQACEFNVYHIIPILDPLALFPITYHSLSNPKRTATIVTSGTVGVKKANKYRRAPSVQQLPKPTLEELVEQGRTSATLSELAAIVRSKNVRLCLTARSCR